MARRRPTPPTWPTMPTMPTGGTTSSSTNRSNTGQSSSSSQTSGATGSVSNVVTQRSTPGTPGTPGTARASVRAVTAGTATPAPEWQVIADQRIAEARSQASAATDDAFASAEANIAQHRASTLSRVPAEYRDRVSEAFDRASNQINEARNRRRR